MKGGYGGCILPQPQYGRNSTSALEHLALGITKYFSATALLQLRRTANVSSLFNGFNDIGVGIDTSVWLIGTNPVNGGFGIYLWNGSTFVPFPEGAVRVAVGARAEAWVVNDRQEIFFWDWNSETFVRVPGAAYDIGVGVNGKVVVIGTDNRIHGLDLQQLSSWFPFAADQPGILQSISSNGSASSGVVVDSDGHAWVTFATGSSHPFFFPVRYLTTNPFL